MKKTNSDGSHSSRGAPHSGSSSPHSSGGSSCEGKLFLATGGGQSKRWKEYFCRIAGNAFSAYRKSNPSGACTALNIQADSPIVKLPLTADECECKRIKPGLAEVSSFQNSLSSSSHIGDDVSIAYVSVTPYFFSIATQTETFLFAASSEKERNRWMIAIKNLTRPRGPKNQSPWNHPAFHETSVNNQMAPSSQRGRKVEKPSSPQPLNRSLSTSAATKRRQHTQRLKEQQLSHNSSSSSKSISRHDRDDFEERYSGDTDPDSHNMKPSTTIHMLTLNNNHHHNEEEEEDDEDEQNLRCFCCKQPKRIFGIKVDTLVRLLKVCSAFPFVIVVAALNLSNKNRFLRSVTGVRIMNLLIYVAPVFYVRFVLSQSNNINVQRLAIGFYICVYLFPVAYVVFSKVKASSSTSNIEDGTFCFKPSKSVRFTQANCYAMMGFIFEWFQHILYVLPLGIVTGDKATRLSDYPPYLSFEVYFWATIICTVLAGLSIILNTVLRGKIHYRFQNSYLVWFFVYNVGRPMFVSFVTILFMGLLCDYNITPAVLQQQPSILCYHEKHIIMSRAALVCVAIYIIQHTLLPSGTFKETMRDDETDIMFVPVYLQAHFLLKAIFCGIYVYFYTDNFIRVIALTMINIMLLILNNFMKPCSVGWINIMRDAFFVHATLSGIQSLNYLAWPATLSTKRMVISTLASNIIFSSIGMYVYYKYFSRSTEYSIATAFLDLEWQVSRGGSVHPRVLEPLISLTLSTNEEDWEIAKKYIGQLVWLISYPNMRVQFQSAWGLANLALLDEDARIKIHEAGGTKTLFEWYSDMAPVVQLEVLAAMANLSLSMEVAEDMVVRHKCVSFFVDLVISNKLKHSQFAAIALSNLARKETYRELIRRYNGIPALVNCIMSHDYQKRRHGARALANIALSPAQEIEQVFESRSLIDRIIKMALRKEIETQREVVALIRNLACHGRLRPLLLDRGVMRAVEVSKNSIFEDVVVWCDEITILMEREVQGGAIDLKALFRREGAKNAAIIEADVDVLRRMEPLEGRVEWSTWGSKLESIFAPVFSTVPTLRGSHVTTTTNTSIKIDLAAGINKNVLQRWRDSLAYTVIEKPRHGRLNEYTTVADEILYTPEPGFHGSDLFSYRMVMGSIETPSATVAITITPSFSSTNQQEFLSASRSNDEEQGNSPSKSIELTIQPGVKCSSPTRRDDDNNSPSKGSPSPYRGGYNPLTATSTASPNINTTPFLSDLMRRTTPQRQVTTEQEYGLERNGNDSFEHNAWNQL